MKYISHEDIKKLLESIAVLHSDIGSETLPERTISAVSEIIPAEMQAFDSFSASNEGGVSWLSPVNAISEQDLQIFAEHIGEHPLLEPILIEKRPEALKVTDFLSTQQFENTGLYNEFYRQIGISSTMVVGLSISPELTMTSSFYRQGKDFSENDSLLLTLLAPHLINTVRNSAAYEQINFALKSKMCGVAAIGLNGKVRYAGEFARGLIEKYFPNEKFGESELPKMIAGWLRQTNPLSGEFQMPSVSLIVKGIDGELRINPVFNSQTREQTIMFEEKKYLRPEMLEQLNLTKREAEILYWMASGKADAEIAVLCNISPYTVYKHAQNIYNKLGVETRTAAMLKALEVID